MTRAPNPMASSTTAVDYLLPPRRCPLARICARLIEHPRRAGTREDAAGRHGLTGRTPREHRDELRTAPGT